MQAPDRITPPDGKLAVFLPGLGAVATTFIAGCLLARAGQAAPIGSLTQMGTVRLGKRTEDRVPASPTSCPSRRSPIWSSPPGTCSPTTPTTPPSRRAC